MKYTSIYGLGGGALDPVPRRWGAGGGEVADRAGFPACSQALAMIEATPVMESLKRFSRLRRCRANNVSKYWLSYTSRFPMASLSAASNAGTSCELSRSVSKM